MKAQIWLALVAAGTLATGCKKDKEEKPAEAPAEDTAETETADDAPDEPAAEEHLSLSDASITLEGKTDDDMPKMLTLSASGEVKADDEVVATLAKTGEMTVDGKVVATLDKDGVVSYEGEEETMVIAEDGSIEDEGKTMVMWNEDGTMGGEVTKEMDGVTFKFQGPPEMRRPMAFVWLSAMMLSSDEASVDEVTEEAAAPAKATPPDGE